MATTDDMAAPLTGKPAELEDGMNRWLFHPLSRRLARALVPTAVTPNMVSVAGGALIVLAGLAYTGVAGASGVLLGFSLHLLWHVVDGADGDLARMTGRASPIGELVDGVCDYAGHVILYLMLGAALDDVIGGWAWGLAVAAGASRVIQSNQVETARRSYLHWAYGVPWLRTAGAARRGAIGRLFGGFARGYVAMAARLDPATEAASRAIERLSEADRARLRPAVRDAARRTLPLQAVLGANWRTVLLAASMAAGSPAWFFLVEIVGLNALLAVSLVRQRAVAEELLAAATSGASAGK